MKPTHITDLLPLLDKAAKVAEKRIAELEQPTSIEEAAEKSFNDELAKETPQKYDEASLLATKHGYTYEKR